MANSKTHSESCASCANRFTNIFCEHGFANAPEMDDQKICISYKKGEYVFKEGTKPYGIYCVNKGKLKLSKVGADGKEQIIRLAKHGDPLGYKSLLSGEYYNSSAIALEDSGVCFISKDMFMSVLQKDNVLAIELMRRLSTELDQTEDQLTRIAQNSVRARVAEAILFIKEAYGYEPDGITIDAAFSREEIANIVGTATETAIRLLSEFKKENLIAFKGKRVQILDVAKLIKISAIND
ncbi:MAG: Crp/Fnr family transcriptional regulator [Bacteroidia bacterium]|nr:MAG: Crp/Fnr family transcriptional regulator [Bacteroidia bacterium]